MRRWIVCILTASVLLGGVVQAQSVHPLRAELERLGGKGVKDCGFVKLGGNTKAAYDCARTAAARKERYQIAVQHQGVDSEVWMAAVVMPDGMPNLVEYDSDPWGGKNSLPRFTRSACRAITFGDGPRGMVCHPSEEGAIRKR